MILIRILFTWKKLKVKNKRNRKKEVLYLIARIDLFIMNYYIKLKSSFIRGIGSNSSEGNALGCLLK